MNLEATSFCGQYLEEGCEGEDAAKQAIDESDDLIREALSDIFQLHPDQHYTVIALPRSSCAIRRLVRSVGTKDLWKTTTEKPLKSQME
ncbi:hypothetical protein RvY_09598 [Ramazzottius varieornatus]|uniref:Uncharacterized protein n=1 Tax=Ramazzottius varieornatus TaxID=947166 RepID=A0A1D1VCB4_RAMVA|nr:hypothetical protein RvY_09598 [Ramazzottius varieornatus]